MDNDILRKYQQVDRMVDYCERIVGHWEPANNFTNMYMHLDELCDSVELLTKDTTSMHLIGVRAKELNKDLDDIVRRLQIMDNLNYDKKKIDFLYEITSSSLTNGDIVKIIIERLKALEKINKDIPNINASIANLEERQKVIEGEFEKEDAEIKETKTMFLESMRDIQQDLGGLTEMQKKYVKNKKK